MNNQKPPVYINISALAIFKVLMVIVLFYFLYLIREILAILFVALVLSSAVRPWVVWLEKRRLPRGVSIFLIYLLAFSVIGGAIFLIIPPISEQVRELGETFPDLLEKVTGSFTAFKEFSLEHGFLEQLEKNLGSVGENLQSAAGSIFSTLANIFGGIVTFFLVLVITFYMVVEDDAIKKIVWSVVPDKHQVYTMKLINRMQNKVGLWLRGQLILSLIIFALTFVGLSVLGVDYALVLALIAGLTEFVPYLGPTLAAIPAIFLAFTQYPMLALFVAVLYHIIQLVENNIIVPKLMQKVVGLNPVVSIAVLLVGFKVGGVVGAVLAIPVATAVSVFLRDYFQNPGAREGSE